MLATHNPAEPRRREVRGAAARSTYALGQGETSAAAPESTESAAGVKSLILRHFRGLPQKIAANVRRILANTHYSTFLYELVRFQQRWASRVAAFAGNIRALAVLISRGAAEINAIDDTVGVGFVQVGAFPLQIAAHRGDVDMIELLLQGSADVNLLDMNGKRLCFFNVELERIFESFF